MKSKQQQQDTAIAVVSTTTTPSNNVINHEDKFNYQNCRAIRESEREKQNAGIEWMNEWQDECEIYLWIPFRRVLKCVALSLSLTQLCVLTPSMLAPLIFKYSTTERNQKKNGECETEIDFFIFINNNSQVSKQVATIALRGSALSVLYIIHRSRRRRRRRCRKCDTKAKDLFGSR